MALRRDEGCCRAIAGCVDRRTRTDEQSNHMVVAIERCSPARRPPFVALSVDVGAQLEKEMHQLSKIEAEAVGVLDEEAKYELREHKMRLDREFGAMLAKIAERREKLGGVLMATKLATPLGKLRQLLMVLEAELAKLAVMAPYCAARSRPRSSSPVSRTQSHDLAPGSGQNIDSASLVYFLC